MSIAIGSDHAGFELKEFIKNIIENQDIEICDYGVMQNEQVDYPDYAIKVADAVATGTHELGIVVCGSGIGVSITANKRKGIRAALCGTEYMAEMARMHNDANVLALGGRTTTPAIAERIVNTFLNTQFEGGRHLIRVEKIHNITNL